MTVPRRALTDPGGAAAGRSVPTRPASPCLATLMSTPAAAMVITRDDPPNEMKGSGIPVTGSTPTTAPMLIKVSAATHATSPRASRAPYRSTEVVAARMPSHKKAPRRTSTVNAPTMPSSSPMTEKMKSVWALGR